jgi:hypothetical protein
METFYIFFEVGTAIILPALSAPIRNCDTTGQEAFSPVLILVGSIMTSSRVHTYAIFSDNVRLKLSEGRKQTRNWQRGCSLRASRSGYMYFQWLGYLWLAALGPKPLLADK